MSHLGSLTLYVFEVQVQPSWRAVAGALPPTHSVSRSRHRGVLLRHLPLCGKRDPCLRDHESPRRSKEQSSSLRAWYDKVI